QNLNNQNNPITPNPITPTTPINQITPTILYPSLQFSRGPLAAPRSLEYSLEGALCTVRWQRGGGSLTDTIHIYAYCPAAATGRPVASVERALGHAQFLLPQEFTNQEIHLWAFAASPDGTASRTAYALPSAPGRQVDSSSRSAARPVAAGGESADERVIFLCNDTIILPDTR
ncbi:MAG: hypothetical protein J6I49_09440, partial [Bacteroidales bacterium]|nr:hypothetical protein [Bacteroidales bacterium]